MFLCTVGSVKKLKPAIHQLVVTLRRGDAIGNTALRTQKVLRRLGYKSEIFRELVEPDLEDKTYSIEDYLRFSSPASILIFHYAMGAELNRFVYNLPDKLVIAYHNITPPEFFIDIHNHVVGGLYHGRKQLACFADHCILGVGVSEFNRRELEEMGFDPTAVLPLALDFSDLDQEPDRFIRAAYGDHKKNFLFVGRIVPNKGIDDLIKLFAHYKKYVDHDSRLIIVGDWSGFELYRRQLLSLIANIDLPDVVMTGRVDFRQLLAFYSLADVYVSLSKHEGFCVPLLEAMHFDIPVMALAAAAVPETMDGAGVLLKELDYAEAAEMLDILASRDVVRERVLEGQRHRLKRFFAVPFEEHLEQVIAKVESAAGRSKK